MAEFHKFTAASFRALDLKFQSIVKGHFGPNVFLKLYTVFVPRTY